MASKQELIDSVSLMLQRYDTCERDTVVERCQSDSSDLGLHYQKRIQLIESRTDSNLIFKCAISKRRNDLSRYTLEELIKEMKEDRCCVNDSRFIDLDESLQLWIEWVEHNRWDPEELISDIFTVLDREGGKRNCVFLCGGSNNGKSMLFAQPIEFLCQNVGRIVNINCDGAFIFEDCRQSRLISIEECCIPKKFADECKKIFGGERCKVNVKYVSGGGMLDPTPCICTSNRVPWLYCPVEEEPLRNRMRLYWTRESFSILKDYNNERLHPLVYSRLYDYYIQQDCDDIYQYFEN